jgi:hypothetical protein
MYYGKRPSRPASVRYVRPPREIKDNTKARRAWLQAELEKLLADGEEAKITGTGSYQSISVKIKREVKTRIQLRGFCQCCGGRWAVTGGKVAHHGYQRPGGGWQTASCMGARYQPLSEDNKRLLTLIATLEDELVRLHKFKDTLVVATKLTMPYAQRLKSWGSPKRQGVEPVTADDISSVMLRLSREEDVAYVDYPFPTHGYMSSHFENLREYLTRTTEQDIRGTKDMLAFLKERNTAYKEGKFVGTTTEEEVPV